MRQTIVSAAHRAHQRGNGTESSRRVLTCPSINDRLTVSIKRESLSSHLFVESRVKQNDFAGDLLTTQRRKMIEAVGDDHLSGEAFGDGCHASTKRRQHNLLRCSRSLPVEPHKLSGLGAAHPVGYHDLLQLNLEAEAAQFRGDILDSLLSLR